MSVKGFIGSTGLKGSRTFKVTFGRLRTFDEVWG